MKNQALVRDPAGTVWLLSSLGAVLLFATGPARGADLWELAHQTAAAHRFSTLFTAQDVRDQLSTADGRERARRWCRDTGVTKVYVESFRDGYQADREALQRARKEFEAAGFRVSGCVTTTQVGKKSSGWGPISCYTDFPTQRRIKEIFEYTAALFDEIMIDDFWFTDCACNECEAARKARTVRVGAKEFPVAGNSWEAYRCELMARLSEENVLAAARVINPGVKIIIKYPQWYDRFHERGYEVLRETEDFDRIWVGTETRDYGDKQWGGTAQYEGYFIMRWLGGIGGAKCGGGWYDWLGTTEQTYIEQARQTVLAGAKESLLFCYGGLQGSTGPADVRALRSQIPELQQAAVEVQKRQPIGVAAYKPANSHPEKEPRVFDFVGMLGIPLQPTHLFPVDAPAAFFSVHALSDPAIAQKLGVFVKTGRPVLMTDGLARRLEVKAPNVAILPVGDDPKSLLALGEEELARWREPLLKACGRRFTAPNRVGFYPFSDGSWVVENFRDDPVEAVVDGETIKVGARGWVCRWK